MVELRTSEIEHLYHIHMAAFFADAELAFEVGNTLARLSPRDPSRDFPHRVTPLTA